MGMKPMDAWHIISANLAHLVRLRRCDGDPKGFVPADTEAEVIAFKALQEMEERMYPKPIGFKDALTMLDQPVWVEFVNAPDISCWGILESVSEIGGVKYLYLLGRYGAIILDEHIRVYRHKPAEVMRDV